MKNRKFFGGWPALLFGFTFIWILALAVAPICNAYLPGMDQIIYVIETNNIDPGEFWYMDIDVSDEASIFMAGSIETVVSGQ